MLIGIAAVSLNNVIWKEWKIPWHVSSEFKFFKETTIGSTLIMGRKTFDSVWTLPGRETIVVSRSTPFNIGEIIELAQTKDVYVCGWAEIYKMFMPHMDKFILSRIDIIVEWGDTFLPPLDGFFLSEPPEEFGMFSVSRYLKME